MGHYRSNLNHNGISAGEVVEITDAELPAWQAEIDDGFFTKIQTQVGAEVPAAPQHGPAVTEVDEPPAE